MGNMIVKYIAAGLVLASLFVLVILGMMPVSQYVVLAVGTLSALGGYHAGSAKNMAPDHIPEAGKMVGSPLFLPQLQNHVGEPTDMVNSQVKPLDPTQPPTPKEG